MFKNKDGETAGKKRFENTAPAIALFVFLLLIFSQFLESKNVFQGENRFLTLIVIQLFVFILPSAVFCALKGRSGFSSYKFKFFPPRLIPFIVVSGIILLLSAALMKYIMIYAFGVHEETTSLYPTSDTMASVILSAAVIPAFAEELFLRGVVFSEYEKTCGAVGAILASSFIFAMLHFSLVDFLPYFAAGLVLGTVTHITNSVVPAIILHFVNNIVSIYTEDVIFRIAYEGISGYFAIFLILALLLIFLALAFAQLEKLYIRRSLTVKQGEPSMLPRFLAKDKGLWKSIGCALMSPVLLILICIFLVYTLI